MQPTTVAEYPPHSDQQILPAVTGIGGVYESHVARGDDDIYRSEAPKHLQTRIALGNVATNRAIGVAELAEDRYVDPSLKGQLATQIREELVAAQAGNWVKTQQRDRQAMEDLGLLAQPEPANNRNVGIVIKGKNTKKFTPNTTQGLN